MGNSLLVVRDINHKYIVVGDTFDKSRQRYLHLCDIIHLLPLLYQRGWEVLILDTFLSFIISVMASIIAYYLCKWMDRNE